MDCTQLKSKKNELEEFIIENYKEGVEKINLSSDYQLPIKQQGAKIVSQLINWPISFLNLSMYKIKDEGMQYILQKGKQWPTLQELKLEKNEITGQGLKEILNCEWNKLKKLRLDKNFIGSEGISEMIKADWPELKVLTMSHCQIGEKGAQLLKKSNWPILQTLNLNYGSIKPQGLKCLSQCKWTSLQTLELSNNKLSGKSMFYLTKFASPNLRKLSLNRNEIGRINGQLNDFGCLYLSKIQSSGLEELHIFGNEISLTGMNIIIQGGILLENCFLEIIRNLFSYEDIKNQIEKHKLFCNYFQD